MYCIQGDIEFPVGVISTALDIESVTGVLRTGPYGRCVYDMDNDVVSQQVCDFHFRNR